jgi:hypothetical protein
VITLVTLLLFAQFKRFPYLIVRRNNHGVNEHVKAICPLFLLFVFVVAACTATDSSTPTPAPTRTPIPIITVRIDELTSLAEANTVAADKYKGKWVRADGYVRQVTQSEISVAGLNAKNSILGIEYELDGFECKYGSGMESQVAELRTGDRITVTGKLTGWDTFFTYNANIEPCEFTVN